MCVWTWRVHGAWGANARFGRLDGSPFTAWPQSVVFVWLERRISKAQVHKPGINPLRNGGPGVLFEAVLQVACF